jgi:hypothetical protein
MARISKEGLEQSAGALQSGDVQAALAVRNREYNRGSGTFYESQLRVIVHILNSTPSLLADCPQAALYPMRIEAAMIELWGENRIRNFVTVEGNLDYRFGKEAIVSMMHSHGLFLRTLEDFHRSNISKVMLFSFHKPDECEACHDADGSSYTVETVPELPLANCTCTNRFGCQVWVGADDRRNS